MKLKTVSESINEDVPSGATDYVSVYVPSQESVTSEESGNYILPVLQAWMAKEIGVDVKALGKIKFDEQDGGSGAYFVVRLKKPTVITPSQNVKPTTKAEFSRASNNWDYDIEGDD